MDYNDGHRIIVSTMLILEFWHIQIFGGYYEENKLEYLYEVILQL